MTPDERAHLRAHLLATGMSGDTLTTRENTVTNAEKLAAGDPDKRLGIGARDRDAAAVMRAVADLCGCSPSLDERTGPGVIDPDRTIDGLELVAARLEQAAARSERVLAVTGHPTGLLPMYMAVVRALDAAGAKVLTPMENTALEPPRAFRRRRAVRYLDGVGVLCAGADVVHTHESWPMDLLLDAVEPPDLVLGDHGWAGASIARGLDVVCFTDVNDPAIAVARADGLVAAVVPLDDNLPPGRYDPLRDHLVARVSAAARNG